MPRLCRPLHAALAFALVPVWLPAASPPRLDLEVEGQAPFTVGESVFVSVYLEASVASFKFLSFGVEVAAGAEVWFRPANDLLGINGVRYVNDRLVDSRHVIVGVGDFDFTRQENVLPMRSGRCLVGALEITVLPAGRDAGQVRLAAGDCVCLPGAKVEPAVLDRAQDGRLSVEGDSVSIVLGDELFVRGDANADGTLDVSDAGRVILDFLNPDRATCQDSSDTNDDGRIDVSDPVFLLNYLFLGGEAPPAPFPGRGADPTRDSLGCRDGV